MHNYKLTSGIFIWTLQLQGGVKTFLRFDQLISYQQYPSCYYRSIGPWSCLKTRGNSGRVSGRLIFMYYHHLTFVKMSSSLFESLRFRMHVRNLLYDYVKKH